MLYLNENDRFAAAWLQCLIADGHLPPAHVDTRSITDVTPADLRGYTQCHFFAGIGGWLVALALAGWPADRPVWTASCPCQPFSVAGRGRGTADERHLWPVLHRLIQACRPPVIFGEQVASADVVGKSRVKPNRKAPVVWLDGIFSDLEAAHYTCGAVDLPAACVGAPHIRQRLYWVAHRAGQRLAAGLPRLHLHPGEAESHGAPLAGGLEHPFLPGLEGHARHGRHRYQSGRLPAPPAGPVAPAGSAGGLAHMPGLSGPQHEPQPGQGPRSSQGPCHAPECGGHHGWRDATFIPCRDGKHRRAPLEPSFFPLAHGLPRSRVGILRGAGNAIVPPLAAEFIQAFLSVS